MPDNPKWTLFVRTSPPGSLYEIRLPSGGALCSSGPVTEQEIMLATAAPDLQAALRLVPQNVIELALSRHEELRQIIGAALRKASLLACPACETFRSAPEGRGFTCWCCGRRITGIFPEH